MLGSQVTSSPQSQRYHQILSVLKDIINDLTGIEPDQLDPLASYLDAGVDSLLLIQFSQAIQTKLGVKISLIQMLEELTSLSSVAALLDERLPLDATPPLPEPEKADNKMAAAADWLPATAPQEPAPALPTMRPHALPITGTEVYGADEPSVRQNHPQIYEGAEASSNGQSPEAAPQGKSSTAAGGGLERILEHQLQVISQQLAVLQNRRFGQQPQPNETTQPVLRAHGEIALPQLAPDPRQSLTATGNGTDTAGDAATPAPVEVREKDDSPKANNRSNASHPQVTRPASGNIEPESFIPYKPLQVGPTRGLSPRQQKYLEDFIMRYTRRTKESKRLAQTYRPYLADGRNSVGFRLVLKEIIYQIVGQRSLGSRIWDADGNEYIDFTMGFGVHLFGHSPDFSKKALETQLSQGVQLGPQSYLAGQAAQSVCEMTGFDRAAFCNSGTEAVMAAMRVARTVTRRNKIAIFTGAYHGWSEGTLAKPIQVKGRLQTTPMVPGVPAGAVADLLVLDHNSPQSLEILESHADELAAVMIEPVQSRRPDVQPSEFLRELRLLTEKSGAALIFDEMVTGFRICPGGAQAVFGVQADLATYGKVVGTGLPIGVIAGKARFMDALDGGMWNFGDNSYPQSERTLFAGAFFKHPLTMAAVVATLDHIKANTPNLHEELNARSARLTCKVNQYFERNQVPVRLVNFGSLFRFIFPTEIKFAEMFFYHMNFHGVFMWEGGTCFLSTAHTDEDVERIGQAVEDSIEEIQEGGFLPETPSVPKSRTTSPPEKPATSRSANSGSVAAQTVNCASARSVAAARQGHKKISFSLYYFGSYKAEFSPDKYDLLWEGVSFADKHGFEAVWIPERHFHEFGGFSPNPSVIAAALARETKRIKIRAGSVVLPLHHPIRVAEEWAVVDNLSQGRVGVSFASGYRPDDFVFARDAYEQRREVMAQGIKTVRKLWRGETIQTPAGAGVMAQIKLFPMPMQPDLPMWLTSNHRETFVKAGELGLGILTNLQDQTIDEMAGKIAAYREALALHGHDPASAHVVVLLHTLLENDAEQARMTAREPFMSYLRSSFSMLQNVAQSQNLNVDFNNLSADELNYLLSKAYERYAQTSALVGNLDSCSVIVDKLIEIGVDEIGCLIDFGAPSAKAVEGLKQINALRERYAGSSGEVEAPGERRERIEVEEAVTRVADQPEVVGAESAVIDAPRRAVEGNAPEPITAPMTEGQKQLWVIALMGPLASRAFNESLTLRMRGSLNPDSMRRAFQKLVDRHETLRTTFSRKGDYQQIAPTLEAEIPFIDLSPQNEGERDARAAELIKAEAQSPFDFANGPLFRAKIVKLEDDYSLFVLTCHHIIADGWSFGVFLQELRELYSAECRGIACQLPEPHAYRQYVDLQLRQQQTAQAAEDEVYWTRKFADAIPILNLPADRSRPPARTYAGDRRRCQIDGAIFRDLKSLCVRQRSTMFALLLATFEVLLHRLSGDQEIVVGTPSAGQSSDNGKDYVGYCIHELVLRSSVKRDPRFTDFLASAKIELFNAHEHRQYPFSRLLRKLNLARLPNQPPVVSAVFIHDKSGPPMKFFDLTVEADSNPTGGARLDLHWNVIEREGYLIIECAYDTDLFDTATIERWMSHYQTLLKSIVADPQRRVSELDLLTAEESERLLVRFNQTATAPPATSLLHQLISTQACRSPLAVAVRQRDQELSYGELERRANRLAHYLRRRGVGPERVVGLQLERSVNLIVALMGILKASGAFLPLDASWPRERLGSILSDAGAKVVVTQAGLRGGLPEGEWEVIEIDERWGEIELESDEEPEVDVDGENLAYVIYTSGSTGKPKGVMACHKNISSNIMEFRRIQGLQPGDRLLPFFSLGFDASLEEILPTLCGGATLVMHGAPAGLLPADFIALLEEERVTALHLLPLYWHQLVEAMKTTKRPILPNLRLFLTGGETPRADSLSAFSGLLRHPFKYLNAYGPTEVTICATVYKTDIDPDAGAIVNSLPIGRPIGNVQVYLLDSHLRPAPVGVTGELYVGGSGITRGYLGMPEMTAEKFIPDPFNKEPGMRLYRTGDLARRLSDGNLEFLGRIDSQAKIRGYRVELSEIESRLKRHHQVSQCVAVVRDDLPEQNRLVAYVVAKGTPAPTMEELRRFLKDDLPEQMTPSWFVFLDTLPLLANGKLDHKALPRPDGTLPERESSYLAPRTELERVIARAWQEALGVERVGVNDHFFEIGGYSLLVVQVCHRLSEETGRSLEVIEFFQHPTVSALARYWAGQDAQDSPDQASSDNASLTSPSAPPAPPVNAEVAGEGIAIIGMAGRFPGAADLDQFWKNLRNGVDAVSFFSDEELLAAGVDPSLITKTNYVKAAGMLNGFDKFDAAFFGYSPREAEIIDPQHRIFLECAWESLEHAGYDSESYRGSIGVYAGVSLNRYLLTNVIFNDEALAAAGPFQARMCSDKDFLPTRVSYKLNLRGPSVNVQTACSTSLVAIHMACRALLYGECEMALAGGVSLTTFRKEGYLYQPGGITSPDGHCRAFDARAQGMVGGNGAGVVVLKRVSRALADGDQIYAVIKGSAINNDGALKVGFTAPSIDGQAEVITRAQMEAGVDPETIDYIEANGTGTPLGDPIEVAALTQAFRAKTNRRAFCALGSVKTNIGHLDAAAGVASLIKTTLALHHKELPPSLHFESPNPRIDFKNSPFYVNTQFRGWERGSKPRRAGVSSFGIGGTNAHVVMEEAPLIFSSGESRPWQLLVLSAPTLRALEAMTDNLANHLEQNPALNLADVAYTLLVGRRAFNHRRVVMCRDSAEVVRLLRSRDPDRVKTAETDIGERSVAFMFPGRGAQHVQMTWELYQSEPFFREEVTRGIQILQSYFEIDIEKTLYWQREEKPQASESLQRTDFAHSTLFVIEYALAKLWIRWGVRPAAMIGHGLGEYVAACLAGVMTLEEALSLVIARTRLAQKLSAGATLAIALAEEELRWMTGENLSLAEINAPRLCVISGPPAAVEEFEYRMGQTVKHWRLAPSDNFHSAMIEPILEEFTEAAKRVKFKEPQIPYISNLTGRRIKNQEAVNPTYWANHSREAVRFADGLGELLRTEGTILLEVGMGETLSALAREQADGLQARPLVQSLPITDRPDSNRENILTALGHLWLNGVKVSWKDLYSGEERRRQPLPTYPFQRERYWVERREPANLPSNATQESLQSESAEEGIRPRRAHPRPELRADYEAPSNETEWRLAEIWADLLGVAQVGVNDNYFELGGDSVIGLQIILRAEQIGLQLTPQDVFQHQTIAQLAAFISQRQAPQADALHPTISIAQLEGADSRIRLDQRELDEMRKKIGQAKN